MVAMFPLLMDDGVKGVNMERISGLTKFHPEHSLRRTLNRMHVLP